MVAGTAGSWWRRRKEAGGCSLWTTASRETLPRATSCACQTSSVPSLHKPLSAAWSMSCPWVGLGQSVVENGYSLYMGRSWPVSCRKLVFHVGRSWPELKTGAWVGLGQSVVEKGYFTWIGFGPSVVENGYFTWVDLGQAVVKNRYFTWVGFGQSVVEDGYFT